MDFNKYLSIIKTARDYWQRESASWYPGKDVKDFSAKFAISISSNLYQADTQYSYEIVEVQDYDLDERLYYKKIEHTGRERFDVIGIDANNTENLIAEVPAQTIFSKRIIDINDEEQKYKKIIIRFKTPIDPKIAYLPSTFVIWT